MEKDELKKFDLNLPLPPGVEREVSTGTNALLAAFDMAKSNG